MSSPSPMSGRVHPSQLQLTNPRSLAVYDSYEDAQRAVDYLSDHGFAVENVLIVGTDLRQVERVTGRMSLGKAVMGGVLSGMWLGLMVGFLMSLFVDGSSWTTIASSVLAGGVFFAIWAAIGYSFTQGKRDFTSVSQVVATRYEILVEHLQFDHANRILRGGPSAQTGHREPLASDETTQTDRRPQTPSTDDRDRDPWRGPEA